jgi:hypothetical protein
VDHVFGLFAGKRDINSPKRRSLCQGTHRAFTPAYLRESVNCLAVDEAAHDFRHADIALFPARGFARPVRQFALLRQGDGHRALQAHRQVRASKNACTPFRYTSLRAGSGMPSKNRLRKVQAGEASWPFQPDRLGLKWNHTFFAVRVSSAWLRAA